MIGILFFGIPAACIAKAKGFKSLRWLLALGIIGFIAVLRLPSVTIQGLSPEEATARAAKADAVGAWMCGINLALGAVGILFVMAMSAS